MSRQTRKDSGVVLVALVLLMLVLAVVGTSLIFTISREAKYTVKDKDSNSALYLAEAGAEYAINRLANVSIGYRGPTTTTLGQGQYIVSVSTTGQPDNYYLVSSTGYIPSSTSPSSQRSLQVIVEIGEGIPEEAVRCKGLSTLESNITLYGVIKTDDQVLIQSNVTLKPDENGHCAIYTSSNVAAAISIGTNFRIDPDAEISTEEMRCRGPENDHDGDPADDSGSGIWKESNIVAGNPSLVENDSSDKTEPMEEDVGIVDQAALLAMVDETYETRETYDQNYDFYLDSKTWLFKEGVTFQQNVNFHGQGTIVVKTYGADVSMFDYGIEFRQNVYGPSVGEYAQVNLIVLEGNWAIKDILMNSNIKIEGLIQGASDAGIEAESAVDIKGCIISNGSLTLRSNVNLIYSEPAFEVPTTESGDTTIISWKEVK